MLTYLVLLFVTVPLVELALLIWIGNQLGVLPTILLVVATGIGGAILARHQGLQALRRLRAALQAGRLPHIELVEGLLVLVAGLVLITPGLLTDICGFLLLVPAVRSQVARRVIESLKKRFRLNDFGPPTGGGDPEVVDVEFTVDGVKRRPNR